MAPIPSTGDLVEVYRLPDYDLVAEPITVHDLLVRPEKNGPGNARFAIAMADDPAYGDIEINDVAAIRRGNTIAAMVIEQIYERTLDDNGAARQTATYSGRLVNSFLEWALIYPALGDGHKPIEEDAIFDWRSPRYDPVAYSDPWGNSTEIMTVTAAKAGGWPTQPMGDAFTDSTGAYMIWHSSGDDTTAPEGTCLFYLWVDITDPGRYGLEVLMDNDGYVWVDGVQQLEINQTEGYHRASFKRIFLSTAEHYFAFQVRNFDGPAALAFNLFKTDHQDKPMDGVPVVAISDSSVQVLEYPDPFPGMTVTDIVGQLVAEAQARGGSGTDPMQLLTWLDPNFDRDDDSDSATPDRISFTTKTGTTNLLQLLDELVAADHVARWRIRPDGVTFDLFVPGYSTRPGNVEIEPATGLDPATGDLLELNRKIT